MPWALLALLQGRLLVTVLVTVGARAEVIVCTTPPTTLATSVMLEPVTIPGCCSCELVLWMLVL